jgi:hypothetical protein
MHRKGDQLLEISYYQKIQFKIGLKPEEPAYSISASGYRSLIRDNKTIGLGGSEVTLHPWF